MKYIKTFEKININSQIDLDRNLMIYCGKKESLGTIRKLIINGANVNYIEPYNKRTPLIMATRQFFFSAVKLLIEKGADVNAKDYNGVTAFMYLGTRFTFTENMKLIVDLFMEKGVDLSSTTIKGDDALSLSTAGNLRKYIQEKYPEEYEIYLLKKDAKKYNL